MRDELVKRLRDAAKMSEALAVLLPNSDGSATAKLYNEVADAIEELSVVVRAQKAVLDKFQSWIPVTERLPEKPGNYLVYANYAKGNLPFVDVDYYSGKNFATVYTCCGYYRVTHWMPLPEPPEKGSEP